MKRIRTAAVLAGVLCLALALSACSPKELAKKAILGAADAMGLRDTTADEAEVTLTYATAGGEVIFPEGMDTTAARVVNLAEGSTLYVSFTGIANRSSDYFYAGGDSVTLTSYASTDAPTGYYEHYKIAVWELSDDQTRTSYVQGSTAYYMADGTCQQYTVSGLTAGRQYKLIISYDTSKYFVTGGVKVEGLGSTDLNTYGDSTANS